MITEKGTVKATTVYNQNLNRELNRPSKILGIVYTVMGGIMLFVYILLAVLSDEEIGVVSRESVALDVFLMTCGAVLLVIGILLIGTYARINKIKGVETKSEENEFFNDYLITREHINGEHVSTAKVYYYRIVRVRETKSYIFIYNTRVTALAVDKNSVSAEELTSIRSLLARPIAGAAAYMKMQNNQPTAPDHKEAKEEGTAEESEVAEEVKPEEGVVTEEQPKEE